jgi:type IV pilus assembly protein PilV
MTTRRKRSRAGYTLIEVMMAVAIMTAGAVALMALSTATIHGNYEARQRTTAVELTSLWIDRLHRDALLWNVGGPTIVFSPLALARTTYLRSVPGGGTLASWQTPTPPITSGQSYAFDNFGRDTTVTSDMMFCTNIRLQWVYVGQAMRSDVRIWWPRTGSSARTSDLLGCAASTSPDVLTTRTRDIHFVYATTVLRWTPLAGAGP